jgi:glycosyltransferase involved in cell wall biosynthesis
LRIKQAINSINPFNWIKVGRELKKIKPDLIVIKYWLPFMAPCFGTILRRVRKNKHTRVISIVDNMIPHEKRFLDVPFTRYFIKPVHAFVAMSKSVLKDIKKFTGKPAYFSPHPLYDHYGKITTKTQAARVLGLDPEPHYLLFFGFIRAYKGLDLLLNAFADERLREFPLKLLVAGEFYDDPKPYHDLIKKHGLEEHVVLHTDFIPDEKVAHYFNLADIVVQPYKSATQSGVTQIAYHFNKPVLVTNVGGLSEIIPHGKVGYVVEPDPYMIVNALEDFYHHRKKDVFLSNIISQKQYYSWENMLKTIQTIYLKLKEKTV